MWKVAELAVEYVYVSAGPVHTHGELLRSNLALERSQKRCEEAQSTKKLLSNLFFVSLRASPAPGWISGGASPC